MASICFMRILLFLFICCSLMLIVNGMRRVPFTHNNKKDPFLLRYQSSWPSIQFDRNSLEKSSLDIQRRNAIMPRICYFARISGTSAHQKLCLPYNDRKRS
jgi:hypothetical protein